MVSRGSQAKMSPRVQIAIREARRIRRNLVRLRGDSDLGGDCGLASLLLADALHDVGSLRHTVQTFDSLCAPHVWNVVDSVILDITATQFNDNDECDDAGESVVCGVLVTRQPRVYHRPVAGRGRKTLAYILETSWYEGQDQRHVCASIERLSNRSL